MTRSRNFSNANSNGNVLRRFLLAASGLAVAPAMAHLGSFAPADGYHINQYTGSVNWADVSYFDAGTYGANAGGGAGPNAIAPDTGLWRVNGPIGGYFTSVAQRTAATLGAPPYPGTIPSGTGLPIYIVGNHFPGRGGDGSNLALRNDTPAGTGFLNYEYDIDTYDTGGVAPTSVTSGVVSQQFYFMPDPGTQPTPGVRARDKFIMSMRDSVGNTGFQWGYADDNEVYWRAGSGPWTYTGVYANIANWDGVRMDIDLTNETFGIDYYDVVANSWSSMVPSGTAMGSALQDFSTLGWELNDAVSTGIGGKNFFDDFSFSIPEPSTAALGLLGMLIIRRRRA